MSPATCLVLMFKAPQRSKQRLAAQIGARAETAAVRLLECAIADLAAWPGTRCLAPATPADAQYARSQGYTAELWLPQGAGNLGQRIEHVNAQLLAAGHPAQIYIGIDCPALDDDYLIRAAAALTQTEVVLGPAHDGGVVLMGVRGAWPPLRPLPWSSAELKAALHAACERANRSITQLEAYRDVDDVSDLEYLPGVLSEDPRPSRQRLLEWLAAEQLR